MLKLYKILFVVLCACVVGTACRANTESDDYLSFLQASEQIKNLDEGDESVAVMNDSKQLKALLEKLNWGESEDSERREIYQKLQSAVQSFEAEENAENSQSIDEKKQKLQEAKDEENSLVNRTIGALGIGATGIGGMQLASGLAEKQADEDAEQSMKAYLATFICKYGDKRVQGGTMNVELPGGNDLLPLVTEYRKLASDLKLRKEALELMPGIESEIINDKAVSGLYDDENLTRSDGVYTSLARALTDASSKDAADWEAQKQEAQDKIKKGATIAAVGAVGSLLANLAFNSSKRGVVVGEIKKVNYDVRDLLTQALDNCNATILDAKLKIEEGTDDFSEADRATIQNMGYLSGIDDLEQLQGHILCN